MVGTLSAAGKAMINGVAKASLKRAEKDKHSRVTNLENRRLTLEIFLFSNCETLHSQLKLDRTSLQQIVLDDAH
ncbi:hypothetical protein NDU88_002972 [Pleurodeles waltl]|uniref:Uncharacterized protein n=1 Tax=Pleurodeles waltl TaxID=8319 RepID=A0AAV7P879_PLEWA|nr:hypothetical protein NDU88_002972 [Pleurodeles waltl]